MTRIIGKSALAIGVGALALTGTPLAAYPVAHGDIAAPAVAPTDAQMAPKGRGGAKRPPKSGGGGHASHPGGGGHASRPGGGSHGGGSHGGGSHGGGPSHGRPPARGGANVNINHNYYDNGHHHGGHDHWDDWDDHWHPLETAATVAVTAAVVGSIVRSVPPNCNSVMINGINYSQCGSTWYQPQYAGTSVQYVVVNPPR